MAAETDFEKLNNAIVRASMKGGEWNKLAVDWKDEVADERSWKSALPVMWSSLLNYYWTRYAELYGKTADKANLASPYGIAPGGIAKALKDLWAPTVDTAQGVVANVQAQIEQAKEAAKAAVTAAAAEVGEAAAKGAQDQTEKWIWALGISAALVGGLYFFGKKTGAFESVDATIGRQYTLVSVNDRTGKRELFSDRGWKPMTHREAVTVLSKFNPRPKNAPKHVRFMIQEI